MHRWTADDIPSQQGRTFIVTGANSGLGYVTARELARHGAHVILTARDDAKGRLAIERLRAGQPDASVELRHLDLSDLDSVKAFADGIIDRVAVDVLINNAGIMMPPRTITKHGHELQFTTNHLGHFALTGLLIETLMWGGEPRVVTVSSTAHRSGSIHFDDLTGARGYSRWSFYAQSKFANVVFGLELDRRLRASRIPMKSVLAHPGYSATNLQSSGPTGLLNLFLKAGNRFLAQDVEIGALSLLYAATEPGVQGGQFIGPDGPAEARGYPTVVRPIPAAKSRRTGKKLWELSEDLTGIRYDLSVFSDFSDHTLPEWETSGTTSLSR